ncbi:signal peptidase I [Austwickia chelonae]|uniref:signal peptidase I n=1 Tax=Austwickia chelonae TaxID=100225 RepID=UPI0009423B0D|nr:signal peptidase I [Austwickia chelonae]
MNNDTQTTATRAERPATFTWQPPFWLVVAVVFLLTLLVRVYVLGVYGIPSSSMESTLNPGDRVIVSKWSGGSGIARGDIVVFDGESTFGPVPGAESGPVEKLLGKLEGHEPRSVYVKRVIGVGGDRIVCCDAGGKITVNGKAINEPYVYAGNPPSEQKFDITVPPGRLWLMGDHRSQSADSRAHLGSPGGGTVAVDDVIGPVMFRYWPLNRIGAVGS